MLNGRGPSGNGEDPCCAMQVHICIHDSSAAAREMLGSIEKDGPTALRRILIVSEASFVENVPQTVAYMYECEV